MADTTPTTITLHSAQARYYRYQTPYLPRLFSRLAQRLDLTAESTLLDLCCGSGEVATGCIRHCGHIYAVDGSAEMLAQAPRAERIDYIQADVNDEAYKAPELVDHIIIGRAIHWVEADSLARLARANLKEDGRIIICSTCWGTEAAWFADYQRLTTPYKGGLGQRQIDTTGAGTLASIGFSAEDQLRVGRRLLVDIDYLIGHAMATTYGDRQIALANDFDNFSQRMRTTLSPHLVDGRLAMDVTSWAIVYCR
ncbi:class I SAM-dependent methyltransferase [Solemya velum gill symbiont]|uniref:class I SAM-dependent methyltransferase n=1 Tax=Solemya velum gill symbiont TaxID=2340 RepID=UPI000996ECDB|nr:class I SAM-dependent methyltransferase [Solemya velum gill symbiont]